MELFYEFHEMALFLLKFQNRGGKILMILMNKINKNFGNLHVLKDINLEVKEGEKVVVIGPSGSGK